MTTEVKSWARKAKVADATLFFAAREVAMGLYDADHGSGLYKKQIAVVSGRGKRSKRQRNSIMVQNSVRKRADSRKGVTEKSAQESPTSDLLKSAHKTMAGLHRIGLVDKKTMQDFDEMCLPKIKEMTAGDIKALRERLNLSQPLFAMYLNTTKSTVSKWEQGDKKPNGIAQCLLNVIANKGLEVMV